MQHSEAVLQQRYIDIFSNKHRAQNLNLYHQFFGREMAPNRCSEFHHRGLSVSVMKLGSFWPHLV